MNLCTQLQRFSQNKMLQGKLNEHMYIYLFNNKNILCKQRLLSTHVGKAYEHVYLFSVERNDQDSLII